MIAMTKRRRWPKRKGPFFGDQAWFRDGWWYFCCGQGGVTKEPASVDDVRRNVAKNMRLLKRLGRRGGKAIRERFCEGRPMGELADWSGLSTAQLKTIFRGDGLEAIPAVDDLEGLVLGVDMLRPSDESAAARVASWAADIRDGRGRRGLDEIEAVTNLDRSFLKSIESGKGLLVVARLADLLVSLERNGIKVSNGFKSMADEAFEWFALRGFSDK